MLTSTMPYTCVILKCFSISVSSIVHSYWRLVWILPFSAHETVESNAHKHKTTPISLLRRSPNWPTHRDIIRDILYDCDCNLLYVGKTVDSLPSLCLCNFYYLSNCYIYSLFLILLFILECSLFPFSRYSRPARRAPLRRTHSQQHTTNRIILSSYLMFFLPDSTFLFSVILLARFLFLMLLALPSFSPCSLCCRKNFCGTSKWGISGTPALGTPSSTLFSKSSIEWPEAPVDFVSQP